MTVKDKIFNFAECLAEHSGGAIRVVTNEKDDTTEKDMEAASFLKLNDKRLGRDLQLYDFLKEVTGEQHMLVMMLEELLLPVKGIPTAYAAGSDILKEWGLDIFDKDMAMGWEELF